MRRLTTVLASLLLVGLSFACTGTRSTLGASALGARVYPLGPQQVDGLLREAMEAEFGTGEVHRVARAEMAYEAELRSALELDVVTAVARAWKGRAEDGAVVDGYVFEVRRSGTLPSQGTEARDRVFERLVDGAERLTPALRQAR